MKTILTIAVPLSVLVLFAASIWYVSFRLRILFGLTRRWPLRFAVTIGFVVSLVFMFSGASSTSAVFGMFATACGWAFCFYIYLALVLLVLHPMQLKWRLPKRGAVWSVLFVAFAVTALGAWRANSFRVSEMEMLLNGLKEDVTVMHISDVHIGHHRGHDYLAQIVAETNRHKPDIVLLNGDLVDSDAALASEVLSPLSEFDAPVYFTGGNHESYVDKARVLELISEHGVRVLRNEVVETHGFYLVGLDYMNPDENTFDMHPSEDKRTIKSVLPEISLPDDKPAVLMHHSPVGIEYVSAKGIDLMLSGHTHAGQVFPATLFAPLMFPFNKGLHVRDGTSFFVSQGAGTYGPRMRLGSFNEINLIRLKVKRS